LRFHPRSSAASLPNAAVKQFGLDIEGHDYFGREEPGPSPNVSA